MGIIGGDLPTRFKYRKVEKQSYGLSADDIFKKTDRELNQIMPLKKLRTYREGSGVEPDAEKGKSKRQMRKEQWHRQHKSSNQSGAPSSKNALSAQRLGAYNLQGDRRAKKDRERNKK